MRLPLATLVLVVAFPTVASAAPFGGFSTDGRYLAGSDRICVPVSASVKAPTCEKITTAARAKLTIEKPKKALGSSAAFSAKASGTTISISAAGARTPTLSWDSGSIAGSVLGVYVNKAKTRVAVEYQSRFGGRMITEVVGFAVAAEQPTKVVGPDPKKPTTTVATGPTLSKDDEKKYDKQLRRAWKQLKRKRWAKTALAASAALAIWDQSAQALVIAASAKARLKDSEAALIFLERLAVSTDPEAPEYRVDARTATAFAKLRANKRFRLAVGITPDPTRPQTAYERVMGFGGKWEQRLIACDQPEVRLTLRRTRKRFTLRIRSKCGRTDITELYGVWSTKNTDELHLKFPNQGANDEALSAPSSAAETARAKTAFAVKSIRISSSYSGSFGASAFSDSRSARKALGSHQAGASFCHRSWRYVCEHQAMQHVGKILLAACAATLAFGCAGKQKADPAAARAAVYSTEYNSIFQEVALEVRQHYPHLKVDPKARTIKTAYHKLPFAEKVESQEDPRHHNTTPEGGSSQSGYNSGWDERRQFRRDKTKREINHFVRFDVRLEPVGAPASNQWRVVVTGQAAQHDGTVTPQELKGAERPYWLDGRIASLEVAIHKRIKNMAVATR